MTFVRTETHNPVKSWPKCNPGATGICGIGEHGSWRSSESRDPDQDAGVLPRLTANRRARVESLLGMRLRMHRYQICEDSRRYRLGQPRAERTRATAELHQLPRSGALREALCRLPGSRLDCSRIVRRMRAAGFAFGRHTSALLQQGRSNFSSGHDVAGVSASVSVSRRPAAEQLLPLRIAVHNHGLWQRRFGVGPDMPGPTNSQT